MFFTLKDGTKVYQFNQPRRWISYILKPSTRRFWRILTYTVLSVFGGAAIVALIFTKAASQSLAASLSDTEVGFYSFMYVMMVLIGACFVAVMIGFAGIIIENHVKGVLDDLNNGKLREFFVTNKDFSYQLMFANPTIEERVKPGSNWINGFFADKSIAFSDGLVRNEVNEHLNGVRSDYAGKFLIIQRLKALTKPGNWSKEQQAILSETIKAFELLVDTELAEATAHKERVEELKTSIFS